jgi:hypothetical protein
VARLALHQAKACAGLLGRWPRDRDPPAVSEASRLLMLPVAARRWVLTDNKKAAQPLAPVLKPRRCSPLPPPLELAIARHWVLTDNTFWHAQWDLINYFIDYIDYFIEYIDYFLRLHRLQSTASSSSATSTSTVKMPNENPITYEELSDELSLKLISSAHSKGPVTTVSDGRDFHLKVRSTRWICLLLQKNTRELSARKSTTWWLIHYINILRVW